MTPVGAPARLRIERADPVATLLMDYLIAGKFVLACAAARAIEKYRAGEDPSDRANPSYCRCSSGTPTHSAVTWGPEPMVPPDRCRGQPGHRWPCPRGRSGSPPV